MTIYFRNPDRYREVLSMTDIMDFSWDYGRIMRQRIDILKWGKLFLGHLPEWRMLIVAKQGIAVIDNETKDMRKPNAVYPAWEPEEGFDQLEDYAKFPVGEDPNVYNNLDIEPQFRPIKGQDHVVVVYAPPDMRSKAGGAMLGRIMEIGKKYPDVRLMIHDTASFRLMFSTDFKDAIFDPYHTAVKGSIIMPSGSVYADDKWSGHDKWIRLLGYQAKELKGKQALGRRLLFNIDSVHWAADNFRKSVNFTLKATRGIDISTKSGRFDLEVERSAWLTSGDTQARMVLGPDDGYACDDCSLSKKCKFYREGMVCGVPKGKTYELTKTFGTRDAGVIIDGLVKLSEIQATRVEADLKEEEETGERSMDTDKRIKDLMDSGVKVAKLINPKLNGGGQTVNVGFIGQNGAAATIAQQTPSELMANAVRALEQNGVAREDITPEMIKGLLEGVNDRALIDRTVEAEAERTSPRVIEGRVSE